MKKIKNIKKYIRKNININKKIPVAFLFLFMSQRMFLYAIEWSNVDEELKAGFSDVANIGATVWRSFLWLLIKSLKGLVDGIGQAVDQVLSFSIYNNPVMKDWLTSAEKLGVLLISFTILVGGLIILFKGNKEIQSTIYRIAIVVVVVLFLPKASTWFYDNIANPFFDTSIPTNGQFGTAIVVSNTIDMQASMLSNQKEYIFGGEVDPNEAIADVNLEYIEHGGIPGMVIDQDVIKSTPYYNQKGVYNEGSYTMEELQGDIWWIPINNQEYIYRYKFNFWHIMLPLAIVGFALFFFAIRTAKTILFEIPISIVLTIAYFVPTSTSVSKIWKVISEILTLIMGLMFSLVTIDIFMDIIKIVNEVSLDKMSFFTKVIVYIALAMALLSGSRFVNKVFGFDTGISDGYQAVVAANQAKNMMKDAGRISINIASGVGKQSKSFGNKLSGFTGDMSMNGNVKGNADLKNEKDIDFTKDKSNKGTGDLPTQEPTEKYAQSKEQNSNELSDNPNLDKSNNRDFADISNQESGLYDESNIDFALDSQNSGNKIGANDPDSLESTNDSNFDIGNTDMGSLDNISDFANEVSNSNLPTESSDNISDFTSKDSNANLDTGGSDNISDFTNYDRNVDSNIATPSSGFTAESIKPTDIDNASNPISNNSNGNINPSNFENLSSQGSGYNDNKNSSNNKYEFDMKDFDAPDMSPLSSRQPSKTVINNNYSTKETIKKELKNRKPPKKGE